MGKIIDRVRARQDQLEAKRHMESLFDALREHAQMLSQWRAEYEAKQHPGEVMLMANRGDEVQH